MEKCPKKGLIYSNVWTCSHDRMLLIVWTYPPEGTLYKKTQPSHNVGTSIKVHSKSSFAGTPSLDGLELVKFNHVEFTMKELKFYCAEILQEGILVWYWSLCGPSCQPHVDWLILAEASPHFLIPVLPRQRWFPLNI